MGILVGGQEMPFNSDKRLYFNEDRTKVVEDGPEARFLFVNEGGEVSDEEAKQYGLKAPKKSGDKDDDEPRELGTGADGQQVEQAKAVEEPPANKARTMKKGDDD
jgi:hypothetical protein